MAKESQKCPMCGTKLKMTDGRMTCKKCGYYIRSQTVDPTGQTSGSYTSQPAGATAAYSGGAGTGTAGSGRPSGNMSSSRSSGDSNPVIAIVTASIIGLVCLAFLVGIVLFRAGAFTKPFWGRDSSTASGQQRESSMAPDSESSSAPESSSQAAVAKDASFPRSDFFCLVAESIWDKPYTDITPEEYASLTALQIIRDDNTIYYQLDGGEVLSLYYESDTGMDLADLSSFPGLQAISIDGDLEKGDLKGLDYLSSVYAENTISELADIIPHPEYITDLGVADTIFCSSLSGLEKFPGLQYLTADYNFLEDISALSQFPDLRGLALTGCDRLTDYSPLMSLTSLEILDIESPQLKSLSFVRQMPNLTSLSIEDTQIADLSSLESCAGLTYLRLWDNNEIADYSIVSQLTQLTELELQVNYGGTLPSLAGLVNLEALTVKYAGDLTPLKDAVNVTYLCLEDCSGWELDSITAMQGLTTLVINDFSSYVDSLKPLTQLPNLSVLSLEDTSVFGNIEEVFSIPSLRQLYLNECQVGMDFDSLPYNENLETLSLSGISILKDPTYNNGDKVKLSEHYDMFEHFPGLKNLYLASLGLDSIAFVEKLPLLQTLDITDNNVESLKPLESLSDFQAVWCGKNTILEKLPEDTDILVFTNDV